MNIDFAHVGTGRKKALVILKPGLPNGQQCLFESIILRIMSVTHFPEETTVFDEWAATQGARAPVVQLRALHAGLPLPVDKGKQPGFPESACKSASVARDAARAQGDTRS